MASEFDHEVAKRFSYGLTIPGLISALQDALHGRAHLSGTEVTLGMDGIRRHISRMYLTEDGRLVLEANA